LHNDNVDSWRGGSKQWRTETIKIRCTYTGFITTNVFIPYSTPCSLELVSRAAPTKLVSRAATNSSPFKQDEQFDLLNWLLESYICKQCVCCVDTIHLHPYQQIFSIFCFYGAFYIVFILYEKLDMVCCIPSSCNNFLRPNNKIFT